MRCVLQPLRRPRMPLMDGWLYCVRVLHEHALLSFLSFVAETDYSSIFYTTAHCTLCIVLMGTYALCRLGRYLSLTGWVMCGDSSMHSHLLLPLTLGGAGVELRTTSFSMDQQDRKLWCRSAIVKAADSYNPSSTLGASSALFLSTKQLEKLTLHHALPSVPYHGST